MTTPVCPNVRFWSKPEVTFSDGHVRSNPKSRRQTRQRACLLRAISVALCNRRPPVNFRYTPLATDVAMRMDWPLPSPRCTTSLQLQTI